jgi:hypothetical protein
VKQIVSRIPGGPKWEQQEEEREISVAFALRELTKGISFL